jgi:hypothetical protein
MLITGISERAIFFQKKDKKIKIPQIGCKNKTRVEE